MICVLIPIEGGEGRGPIRVEKKSEKPGSSSKLPRGRKNLSKRRGEEDPPFAALGGVWTQVRETAV